MQPTLNGIIGHSTRTPRRPASLVQAFDFVMRGRNYVNVIAKSDDNVVSMTEHKMLFFFTLTDIQCSQLLLHHLGAHGDPASAPSVSGSGNSYHAGDLIARGYIDAGDHVFVDKISYNLHTPTRGEVFVFSTRGIARIEERAQPAGNRGLGILHQAPRRPPARYPARRFAPPLRQWPAGPGIRPPARHERHRMATRGYSNPSQFDPCQTPAAPFTSLARTPPSPFPPPITSPWAITPTTPSTAATGGPSRRRTLWAAASSSTGPSSRTGGL